MTWWFSSTPSGSAEVLGAVPTPWTVDLLMITQPLHFGDYGGIPLKTLRAVLAIGVLVSVLVLWVKRKRWGMRFDERVGDSGATAAAPSRAGAASGASPFFSPCSAARTPGG